MWPSHALLVSCPLETASLETTSRATRALVKVCRGLGLRTERVWGPPSWEVQCAQRPCPQGLQVPSRALETGSPALPQQRDSASPAARGRSTARREDRPGRRGGEVTRWAPRGRLEAAGAGCEEAVRGQRRPVRRCQDGRRLEVLRGPGRQRSAVTSPRQGQPRGVCGRPVLLWSHPGGLWCVGKRVWSSWPCDLP